MPHRLICAILAALMPLLLAAPAFAQDPAPMPGVICGDLSADDCALLEESAMAARDLTSYAMNMSMDFSMGGIPDLPVDPIAFSILFDGRFVLDETSQAVIQRMEELQRVDGQIDMSALAEEMPALVVDLYRGMNFDMTMTYNLPAELADLISQDSEVAMPQEMIFDVRLIDGMMYINLADLRTLIPEGDDSLTADWMGMDYIGLLEMQLAQAGMGQDSSFTSGAMGGLLAAQIMQDMQQFVSVERLDDVDLSDQQGAVFAYTADVAGFLASDTFLELMRSVTAAMGDEAPSATEVEQAAQAISFTAPMIFRDLNVETSSTIGLDDKLTHATTFDFSWDLAALVQLAAMGDPELAASLGDAGPLIAFNIILDMSDFNDEMIFEVPEDVQMIPLEQMMPPDTSTVF